MNQYTNIPEELRALKQWVAVDMTIDDVTRKPKKHPVNPKTGNLASVTDPSTWGSFDEAVYFNSPCIGFVFTQKCGYTGIDLDEPETEIQIERHSKIYENVQSFSEFSISGKGVHIIVKGSIPNGVRRDKCEIYSNARYFIMTGNVIRAMEITDQQPMLDELYASMYSDSFKTNLTEIESSLTDEQVIQMATNAHNSEKFNYLYKGQMNGYPSQSEADFALISMLSFYSKSNEQVRRLFRNSTLGQRDKAQKNDVYIDRALEKIRGRQEAEAIPQVDFSALLSRPVIVETPIVVLEESIPDTWTGGAPSNSSSKIINPPGLIGEISDYIYSSAIRQVHEVALTASLGFLAGIAGRQFNISSYGLNQYIVLIAKTGRGKEGGIEGIDRLVNAMTPFFPNAQKFVGPSAFASGQGLTKSLDKNTCYVSVLNEIGSTFKTICDPKAPHHLENLRKMWLDLYSKSGWNKFLRPTVYSDSDKDTATVRAPNVSILGDSGPDIFFGSLSVEHIVSGLIPRFIVIPYTGIRHHENAQAFHNPTSHLVQSLTDLAKVVQAMESNTANCTILKDIAGEKLLKDFGLYADDKINESDELRTEIWNRAQLKALKLAGLVAVGCNNDKLTVTKEIAQWAIDLVMFDTNHMISKFDGGEIGEGDHKQASEVRRVIDDYNNLAPGTREKYKVPSNLSTKPELIPYVFLRQRLFQLSCFKNDRRGAREAIDKSIAELIKAGILQQLPIPTALADFGATSPIYFRGQSW